jgi:hypothetical protein
VPQPTTLFRRSNYPEQTHIYLNPEFQKITKRSDTTVNKHFKRKWHVKRSPVYFFIETSGVKHSALDIWKYSVVVAHALVMSRDRLVAVSEVMFHAVCRNSDRLDWRLSRLLFWKQSGLENFQICDSRTAVRICVNFTIKSSCVYVFLAVARSHKWKPLERAVVRCRYENQDSVTRFWLKSSFEYRSLQNLQVDSSYSFNDPASTENVGLQLGMRLKVLEL